MALYWVSWNAVIAAGADHLERIETLNMRKLCEYAGVGAHGSCLRESESEGSRISRVSHGGGAFQLTWGDLREADEGLANVTWAITAALGGCVW